MDGEILTRGRASLRAVVPAAILLLPLIALAGAGLQTMHFTFHEYQTSRAPQPDLAREMDQVMAQLDDVLPRYGRIGYLDPQYFAFQTRAVRQFYLTQYALAPRVVLRDTTFDYVIYFSHEHVPLMTAASPAGMSVLR